MSPCSISSWMGAGLMDVKVITFNTKCCHGDAHPKGIPGASHRLSGEMGLVKKWD